MGRLPGLMLDAVFWLCVWAVFVGHNLAVYADRYLIFFAWLATVTGVAMSLVGAKKMEKMIRDSDAQELERESRLMTLYYDSSPVFEALALAVLGHWIVAAFYCLGSLSGRGAKREALRVLRQPASEEEPQ